MKVWVVSRCNMVSDGVYEFEIMGAFSTEQNAIAACHQENDGYGALELDVYQGEKRVLWPGFRYPLVADEPPLEIYPPAVG